MIKGIGIDLIELDRIKKSIEKEKFIERILTEKERELLSNMVGEQRKIEFVAGRFAAKEAFAKAVGTGIGGLSFQHIEITSNNQGAPNLNVQGYESYKIFISITHSRDYAVAQVVIEDK